MEAYVIVHRPHIKVGIRWRRRRRTRSSGLQVLQPYLYVPISCAWLLLCSNVLHVRQWCDGRPIIRWMHNIRHDMNRCSLEEGDTQDRRKWCTLFRPAILAGQVSRATCMFVNEHVTYPVCHCLQSTQSQLEMAFTEQIRCHANKHISDLNCATHQ